VLPAAGGSLAGNVFHRDGYADDLGERIRGPQGGDDAAVQGADMSFPRSALGRLLGYREFIVESAGKKQALRSINFLPYPE
jgi:hypothetical protein